MSRTLILASGSEARATLLREAGVPFEAVVARIDEAAFREAMVAEGAPPRDIADGLADLKARRVARSRPDAMVLGCDQILVCEGRMFGKPGDLEAARQHLRDLRGRAHELLSAAVVYEDGAPVWRHVGRARLTMRMFSDAFLDAYVTRHGSRLLASNGAYQVEEGGSQIFNRIEGDYFSILGLPLLELLAFLRTRGTVQE